jgi:hypothetical protein
MDMLKSYLSLPVGLTFSFIFISLGFLGGYLSASKNLHPLIGPAVACLGLTGSVITYIIQHNELKKHQSK